MLAYAAHRRPRRRLSPATLSLIIGGHAVALAFLISAKMEVNPFVPKTPIRIEAIPLPEDPPPPDPKPQPQIDPQSPRSTITPSPRLYPPLPDNPVVDSGPPTTDIIPEMGPIIDAPIGPRVEATPPPPREMVKQGPRLATAGDLLRPAYPASKLRTEEEAVLKLRLQIDERGRVVGVDPVGTADPEFLASARRHLTRHWRYKPATEDGRPVASTIVITLRFEMRDV